MKETLDLVMSYDKGIEHNGTTYATLFGPNYSDERISWNSMDRDLLAKINREVFKMKGCILPYSETQENTFVLFIDRP